MITISKIVREIPYPIDRRQWVVSLDSAGVTFRQKRHKHPYPTVPWSKVWAKAMMLSAEEERKKRIEKRKQKRAFV